MSKVARETAKWRFLTRLLGLPQRASRVGLIACVCELDDELLVVLNPRRFLAVIEQSLAATT
jgi:hypothetical protein